MLRKLVKYFFLGLVLLLVFLSAALLAMRFAIQGREVRVPRLAGLTPVKRNASPTLTVWCSPWKAAFTAPPSAEGRIVSQAPAPDSTVRRGWKIRVAESLGRQRAAVPTLIGQSQHAAGINISRRRLEIGSVGSIHLPGAAPETVVAQNPPPDATEVTSPKVGLIFSAADNGQRYVMPSFVGRPLAEGMTTVEKGGFTLGKIHTISEAGISDGAANVIVRQSPAAGQRVTAGATISFDVRK